MKINVNWGKLFEHSSWDYVEIVRIALEKLNHKCVYSADNDEIKKYSIAAKTKKGFDDYMKNYLFT